MPDAHYLNPRLVEIYDLDSPWSADREFYLSLATEPPQDILDLGCGTGLLCDAYAAKGHNVTGADPSLPMLDVARRKPNGAKISWVHSDAQNFSSKQQFDLIVMTGHAFQVLLEDPDVLSVFATVRDHLKPSGKFVFESRNPLLDWKSRWDYDLELNVEGTKVLESRRFISIERDRMHFELLYRFPDEQLVSNSELRFWSKSDIENHLSASQLVAPVVLGDWEGKPFSEQDEEMIFVIRRKE
jgi:Methylase involved in ubiquinone/menaquinone biosynthesis